MKEEVFKRSMRKFFFVILTAGLFSPMPVKANAYQMGMQWCQMVRSGMDAAASWNMIKDSYVNGRFQNTSRGDPYAPWSPTRTWSGAIGGQELGKESQTD